MRKIKGILGLGLVLALVVSMVPAVSAKAAKTFPIIDNVWSDEPPYDYLGEQEVFRITVSTDSPKAGSTIEFKLPKKHKETDTLSVHVNECQVRWDAAHEYWEEEIVLRELVLDEAEGTLDGNAETVTVTLENDCEYVWGAVNIKVGEYTSSGAAFSWYNDGEVWNSNPWDGDAQMMSPIDPNAPAQVAFEELAEGAVYRLGNPTNGDHIYTINKDEARGLVESGWNQETSPGESAGADGVAIYRLTNDANGEHLFTADKNEKNFLSKNGWTVDNDGNPAFYGSKEGKAVYRLFNPNAQSALDSHHFTLDKNEIKVLTTKFGWVMDNDGKAVYYLN